MTWTEICSHPSLRNLPYKIEMSEWGNVEMIPRGVNHAKHQAWIMQGLQRLKPDGVSSTQAAVETAENVKVSDVIWASKEHWEISSRELTWSRAPEICVEIFKPYEPLEEAGHKAKLYLRAGALEFWACNDAGAIRFHGANGMLERSQLCPEFPLLLELPFESRVGGS